MGTQTQRMAASAIEKRVDGLLARMTLEEKTAILSGKDNWRTVEIRRLGISSLTMTDGPHGVRTCDPQLGRKVGPATCFRTGISMAASWDPDLIRRVGEALGQERRALGCDVLLGPCVNIVRRPQARRTSLPLTGGAAG